MFQYIFFALVITATFAGGFALWLQSTPKPNQTRSPYKMAMDSAGISSKETANQQQLANSQQQLADSRQRMQTLMEQNRSRTQDARQRARDQQQALKQRVADQMQRLRDQSTNR